MRPSHISGIPHLNQPSSGVWAWRERTDTYSGPSAPSSPKAGGALCLVCLLGCRGRTRIRWGSGNFPAGHSQTELDESQGASLPVQTGGGLLAWSCLSSRVIPPSGGSIWGQWGQKVQARRQEQLLGGCQGDQGLGILVSRDMPGCPPPLTKRGGEWGPGLMETSRGTSAAWESRTLVQD